MLLAFIMVPLVQKELDVFRETVWNTHTEYEHRKIQYFRTEYQTTSITFQSNMTLKTVISVIPLVNVKKKKRKKEKKKSVWVALKRKWRGNGQKKRSM